MGRHYVVEDLKGRRVGDIRKGWARAVQLAEEMAAAKGISIDLTDVVPHSLRHTAITWALQRGATLWDVAGMFSVSIETIQQVYGHHSPDWQKSAVDAMSKKS
jgi:integrase